MSNSVTPWTTAQQAPLSMEFSRQEYWSALPLPSPGWIILQWFNTEIEQRGLHLLFSPFLAITEWF